MSTRRWCRWGFDWAWDGEVIRGTRQRPQWSWSDADVHHATSRLLLRDAIQADHHHLPRCRRCSDQLQVCGTVGVADTARHYGRRRNGADSSSIHPGRQKGKRHCIQYNTTLTASVRTSLWRVKTDMKYWTMLEVALRTSFNISRLPFKLLYARSGTSNIVQYFTFAF